MKHVPQRGLAAFTLIELLVVITIIGIMMALASTVLRDTGTGRTLDSGVDMLTNMVQEARATAIGNDTYTRLVIVDDPRDTSQDTRHLRFMVVQMLRRQTKDSGNYDASSVTTQGEWVSTSAGTLLPAGVFFSPTYSRPLGWAEGSGGRIGTAVTRIGKSQKARVFYFEFDEKGRFVAPGSSPASPSAPQRLVLVNARAGNSRHSVDGIIPLQTDSMRRPVGVKGIVIWPTGYTSPMRTREQIFHD